MSIRLQNTGTPLSNVKVALLQGSTTIASWILQPASGFQTYPLQLTSAQVSAITDYNNLQVMVQTVTCSVARVQFATATGTPGVNNKANATWSQPTTAGNMLVAVFFYPTGLSPPPADAGTQSGWSLAIAEFGNRNSGNYSAVYIYYYPNAPSQTSTGNFGTNIQSTGNGLIVAEYSGCKTAALWTKRRRIPEPPPVSTAAQPRLRYKHASWRSRG